MFTLELVDSLDQIFKHLNVLQQHLNQIKLVSQLTPAFTSQAVDLVSTSRTTGFGLPISTQAVDCSSKAQSATFGLSELQLSITFSTNTNSPNTQNIFAGQIQTETPYFQPNPPAPGPFPYVASLNDPQFSQQSVNNIPAANSWGIRLLNAKNILIYGAGHYSFFDNYSTSCSAQGNGAACQNSIVSVEGSSSSVSFYNLNTVGSHYAFSINGATGGLYSDNANGFISTIALFRPN
ncbi:hypothetical protein MRB53_040259 [Persea americana]|nr:hypothetical protein MRB53_040259 [Persea americana]